MKSEPSHDNSPVTPARKVPASRAAQWRGLRPPPPRRIPAIPPQLTREAAAHRRLVVSSEAGIPISAFVSVCLALLLHLLVLAIFAAAIYWSLHHPSGGKLGGAGSASDGGDDGTVISTRNYFLHAAPAATVAKTPPTPVTPIAHTTPRTSDNPLPSPKKEPAIPPPPAPQIIARGTDAPKPQIISPPAPPAIVPLPAVTPPPVERSSPETELTPPSRVELADATPRHPVIPVPVVNPEHTVPQKTANSVHPLNPNTAIASSAGKGTAAPGKGHGQYNPADDTGDDDEPTISLMKGGSGAGNGRGSSGTGLDRGPSGANDLEPKVLNLPLGDAPISLQLASLKGPAKFQVVIKADGSVGEVKLIKSSGNEDVDAFYKQRIYKGSYRPAYVAGKSIDSVLNLTLGATVE